jgi:hypothetical protein
MDAQMDDDIAFAYSTGTGTGTGTSSGHGTFGQSSQGYYSRQQQQQEQEQNQSPFSSLGQFLIWLLDVCTGPSFGILVAVVVIVLLQFKGSLLDLFYNALEDGPQQTLLEVFDRVLDLTRAYYQMACELVRSLRLFGGTNGARLNAQLLLPNSTRLRTHLGSSPPPLVTVLEYYSQEEEATNLMADADVNAHVNAHVTDNDPVTTTTTTTTTTRSRGVTLTDSTTRGEAAAAVELNGSISAAQQQQQQQHALSERSSSPSMSSSSSPVPRPPNDGIEPAFLNENDYPPGWLVYHPALGVVPKEEADQYDKDQSTTTTTTTTSTHNNAIDNNIILAPSIAARG